MSIVVNRRLSGIRFIDPKTKNYLLRSKHGLIAESGVLSAYYKDKKWFFLDQAEIQSFTLQRDPLDVFKSFLKFVFGRHYKMLIWIVSQHMPRIHWRTHQTYLSYTVRKFADGKKIVLNLGSGNDRYSENIINIDIFPFKEVDVVARAEILPFPDNYIDGIINTELLEHVEDPESVLREAYRVLKNDGFIITAAPFIENFHGSPKDFYRWSHMGLVALHEKIGFKIEKIVPLAGPTASLISIVESWIALLLSFNVKYLYYFWIISLSILFLPLKLFDLFLIHFKMSYSINASNMYIGKK